MTEQNLVDSIHYETKSWNEKSVKKLLKIFHPNFVWIWPKNNNSYDPLEWESPMGMYNKKKWTHIYKELFTNFDLLVNERKILKTVFNEDKKSGFAIVDINTVWENIQTKEKIIWKGRTCKIYLKHMNKLKIISHHGVLEY